MHTLLVRIPACSPSTSTRQTRMSSMRHMPNTLRMRVELCWWRSPRSSMWTRSLFGEESLRSLSVCLWQCYQWERSGPSSSPSHLCLSAGGRGGDRHHERQALVLLLADSPAGGVPQALADRAEPGTLFPREERQTSRSGWPARAC